jgi:hemerythrin-like domain-containing protein
MKEDSMNTITDFLTPDHQRCDTFFADAESAAANGNWGEATSLYNSFVDATLHHFAMEEEVLFPAFDKRTGMLLGPTDTMRMEHRQMNDLMSQMTDAVQQHNKNTFLGLSETLLMIMQQHNLKEEQMLYRMADQMLCDDSSNVVDNMKKLAA